MAMSPKAKRNLIIGGVVVAGVVGFAATAGASEAPSRDPWPHPLAPPSGEDELAGTRAALCSCYRGGATEREALVTCALDVVYEDVPADVFRHPQAGDHPSIAQVRALFRSLADELLALVDDQDALDAWCDSGDVPPPMPPPPPMPEPPGAGPSPGEGVPSYVGYDRAHNKPAKVYHWPHQNKFPDEQSFAVQLAVLSYVTQNADPISGEMMRWVKTFQRDYNEVRRAWLTANGQPLSGMIVTDGLIGNATINALIWADAQQKARGPWMGIVSKAYGERGLDWPGVASL